MASWFGLVLVWDMAIGLLVDGISVVCKKAEENGRRWAWEDFWDGVLGIYTRYNELGCVVGSIFGAVCAGQGLGGPINWPSSRIWRITD
jgi:hypothetical protein